jgi:hypothetical protein
VFTDIEPLALSVVGKIAFNRCSLLNVNIVLLLQMDTMLVFWHM